MATIERIQQLLNCAERVAIKDDAGIIIPSGVDASIKAKAIKECLRIVESADMKEETNDI